MEQDIYNKRITELLKRKTALIEALTKLLELANKPDTRPKEDTGLPVQGNRFAEALHH